MRILFVSNFYPPFEKGGWEQLAFDLVNGLTEKGHECFVITSSFMKNMIVNNEERIYRVLHLEGDLKNYDPFSIITQKAQEEENNRLFLKIVREVRPDFVFFHSMWNIPRSIACYAEKIIGDRVVYYMAGDWPYLPSVPIDYWLMPARGNISGILKKIISVFFLHNLWKRYDENRPQFKKVLFVSKFQQEKFTSRMGKPEAKSRVIYNGINTDIFCPPSPWNPKRWRSSLGPRFVYYGQLSEEKGVRSAIVAFSKIVSFEYLGTSTLTIIGGGHPDYEANLRELTFKNKVKNRVIFMGQKQREEMPELLKSFDISIFPSKVEEALSRSMQEAMSSGLLVVGTTTGGSKELLEDGVTGLTFSPGNAEELAKKLLIGVNDSHLREKLTMKARKTVSEQFSIEKMVNEIEDFFIGELSNYER